MPSVFVSYSHDPANPEHSHKVLGLAASLMRDGLTVFIDQNRSADEEKIPWPSWMEDKIESADHVLLVCTELYLNKVRQKVPNDVGHGVCWEANLIYNALYLSKLNTRKFIPVVFTDSERQFIPTPLRGANSFVLDSPSAYKRLFAFLTGQHRLRFPKQGAQLPVIAEEEVEPMFPPANAIASSRPGDVEKTKRPRASASQGTFERAKEAAHFIEAQTALRPRIALLLGAAFDSIADQLTDATTVRYETIPHFPCADSSSRAGRLVIGKLADVPLAVLCGRLHYYEGLGLDAVVFPIRILARMGICSIVITSAAGGVNPAFTPGSLVVLSDHINLLGSNPMIGPQDERLGSRFADMSEVYKQRYREIALSSADNLGFSLAEGVFAGLTGPSYETPAEIRSLRNQGVDVVGMSILPEVIAARHLGIGVLAICAVTNVAVGLETKTISHREVLSLAQQLPKRLTALLERVIAQIAAEL
jgi:purine-nucleoside phosphorylase